MYDHTFAINLILVTTFFVYTKVRINGQIVVASGCNGSDDAAANSRNGSDDTGRNGTNDDANDRNGSNDAVFYSMDVYIIKKKIEMMNSVKKTI